MSEVSEIIRNDDDDQQVLNGVLVRYIDDQLDDCVASAIKRKSRVRYKCLDTFANFLAFGTSGGAIYLFKLKTVTHSSCQLASMIPCDQGSIEVIKFLPNPQDDDLLIAIGTSRGSLVVFRLTQLPNEDNVSCDEVYKAENFTSNCAIKMIEYDKDLVDPSSPFSRIYICDTSNRLYVLESGSIYPNKQTLRLFYQSNNLPALIFSVNHSNINQIDVHRSQLLISTNETTYFYNETLSQPSIIGRKKRREGFYGACFFNPNYKPLSACYPPGSQQSINELDNIMIFAARPMFRLWQVSNKREVVFTHQFEPLIKQEPPHPVANLQNEPVDETRLDDSKDMSEAFIDYHSNRDKTDAGVLKSDHFQRLMPIYSSTLGNLILSYTQHELFILDPTGARLIVWYHHSAPIIQICCNENEIFVWSQMLTNDESQRGQFRIDRLVLLAPTQFILELHRIHRYLTLALIVQLFHQQFRTIMALPLSGKHVITTEGGLLRNILLNAWDIIQQRLDSAEQKSQLEEQFAIFKEMIDSIVGESNQLKQSLDDLTDSRFFLAMATENLERLCCEPYTSLVSLEISIANLHTNHVIHFSKEALNRHKSVANLSNSIKNLNRLKQTTRSNLDIRSHTDSLATKNSSTTNLNGRASDLKSTNHGAISSTPVPLESKVIVERQKPNKQANKRVTHNLNGQELTIEGGSGETQHHQSGPFFSPRTRDELLKKRLESHSPVGEVDEDETNGDNANGVDGDLAISSVGIKTDDLQNKQKEIDLIRCSTCHWPRPRSHLKTMHSSQLIQYNWIQENLLANFEENIDLIEERSFKHGLWNLFLRCLAYSNKLDDYITCCILLDDVRLLFINQTLITTHGEDKFVDYILMHLGKKVKFLEEMKSSHDDDSSDCRLFCFKCKCELERYKPEESDDYPLDNNQEYNHHIDDEISFNLVNIFEQFMIRRNADMIQCVNRLLRHPDLLNASRIPTKFYLRVIEKAVEKSMIANQATINRNRLKSRLN